MNRDFDMVIWIIYAIVWYIWWTLKEITKIRVLGTEMDQHKADDMSRCTFTNFSEHVFSLFSSRQISTCRLLFDSCIVLFSLPNLSSPI